MSEYKGVLFDIDGVIADTVSDFTWIDEVYKDHFPEPEEAGFSSWEDYLSTYGDAFRRLSKEEGEELLEGLEVDSLDVIETYQALQEKKERIMDGFSPFEDGIKILEQLDRQNIKIAAVSNASEPNTRKFLEENDLIDFFDYVTGAGIESFEQFRNEKKPNPYMLEKAIDELDLDPSEVLMIGDSTSDRAAAENAGIDFVRLKRGDKKNSKADNTIENLEELSGFIFNQ